MASLTLWTHCCGWRRPEWRLTFCQSVKQENNLGGLEVWWSLIAAIQSFAPVRHSADETLVWPTAQQTKGQRHYCFHTGHKPQWRMNPSFQQMPLNHRISEGGQWWEKRNRNITLRHCFNWWWGLLQQLTANWTRCISTVPMIWV